MKANNSKRITNAMIKADLDAFKAETKANFKAVNTRVDKAAIEVKNLKAENKAIKTELAETKARLEVLEHANTKTAPAKNQPKAETGKAKTTKAPTKTKAKAKNKVWVAKKDRDKVYKAMSEKAPGAEFNRKLYEELAIELGVAHEYTK